MARAGTVTIGMPTTWTFTGAGAQPASTSPAATPASAAPLSPSPRHWSNGAIAASRYGASHDAAVAVRWFASR